MELTLTMPDGLLRSFLELITTLEGFFRYLAWREKIAKGDALSNTPEAKKERKENIRAFDQEVCNLYDSFIRQGMDCWEALSATNKAMKSKSHPWAKYSIIRDVLSQHRRFRKRKAHGEKK